MSASEQTPSAGVATPSGAARTHSADAPHDVRQFVAFLRANCDEADRVDMAWLNRAAPMVRARIRAASVAQLVCAVLVDDDVMVIAAARDELRKRWRRAGDAPATTTAEAKR